MQAWMHACNNKKKTESERERDVNANLILFPNELVIYIVRSFVRLLTRFVVFVCNKMWWWCQYCATAQNCGPWPATTFLWMHYIAFMDACMHTHVHAENRRTGVLRVTCDPFFCCWCFCWMRFVCFTYTLLSHRIYMWVYDWFSFEFS